MIGAMAGIVAALVPAPVPAAAGAGAARPPVALTAAPARLDLTGSTRASVRIANSGTTRVLVDVSRAGFALDLRGRPRVVRAGGPRSAAAWLALRPTHFVLAPHAGASLAVTSKLPLHVEPGDHDALVLLSTRPIGSARLTVRVRMGVVVVVRAPGKIVRRLELGALSAMRRGRALDLVVVNRGNVTESLRHERAVVSSVRGGRVLATLDTGRRDLRPRTRGIVGFRFRGRRRGPVVVRIAVVAEPGPRILRRTYRVRL